MNFTCMHCKDEQVMHLYYPKGSTFYCKCFNCMKTTPVDVTLTFMLKHKLKSFRENKNDRRKQPTKKS